MRMLNFSDNNSKKFPPSIFIFEREKQEFEFFLKNLIHRDEIHEWLEKFGSFTFQQHDSYSAKVF